MLISYFIILLLLIGINTYVDWYKIKIERRSPNHEVNTLIRACVFLLNSIISLKTFYIPLIISSVAFQASLFWLIFDISLNLSRGLGYDYIGSTAKIDRFYRRSFGVNSFYAMTISKLILISITFIFFNHYYVAR